MSASSYLLGLFLAFLYFYYPPRWFGPMGAIVFWFAVIVVVIVAGRLMRPDRY